MTYNAAARTTTFYLWSDEGLVCDNAASVLSYSGQYNSVTYDSSTGKITAKISSNTSESSTKSGQFTIALGQNTLTVNMTQSEDAVSSTNYELKNGSASVTSASGTLNAGSSTSKSVTVTATCDRYKKYTYVSGKTSTSTFDKHCTCTKTCTISIKSKKAEKVASGTRISHNCWVVGDTGYGSGDVFMYVSTYQPDVYAEYKVSDQSLFDKSTSQSKSITVTLGSSLNLTAGSISLSITSYSYSTASFSYSIG